MEAGLPQNEGQNILNSKGGRSACDEQEAPSNDQQISIWGGEFKYKEKILGVLMVLQQELPSAQPGNRVEPEF